MHYPKHIALIPDGNRTRAKENGLPKIEGHFKGFENAVNLAKRTFRETPVDVFTLWGLSTENLQERPKDELEYLFHIYKSITEELEDFLLEGEVNLRRAWSPVWLPKDLLEYMKEQSDKISFPDSKRYLVIAINYGGRDEIIRGVHAWQESDEKDKPLTEAMLDKYMDFGHLPHVELVVRTKGDKASRISGFMSRWIGYAELYFTPKKFPEFDEKELTKALERFDEIAQKRNFGK